MNANMKAMAGTAYNPVTMLNPNTIAKDAPNAAPDDMPRTYGEAIGFRKSPCIAAPAIASEAPTSPPNNTRGKRMLSMHLMRCRCVTAEKDFQYLPEGDVYWTDWQSEYHGREQRQNENYGDEEPQRKLLRVHSSDIRILHRFTQPGRMCEASASLLCL
jgi:hypothetical protein